jgi:putative ABC transport system permease protein
MGVGGIHTLVERRVIRRGPLATVALVLIIAASAGATMAAAAGGRRASTSYDRLIEWTGGTVANVPGGGLGDSESADAALTQIAALPGIEHSTRSLVIGDAVEVRGTVVRLPGLMPLALDTTDPAVGRVKVLEGRLPDPAEVGEAVVPLDTAERFDLRVGDTVEIRFDEWQDRPDFVAGVEPVTVVGVVAHPGSFPSMTAQPTAVVLLTPAFRDAHAERIDWTNADLQVLLTDPSQAGVDAFRSAVSGTGIPVDFVGSIYDDAIGVRKVVRIEAGVLWLVAAVIAVATIVVAAQFFRREAADAGTDIAVLRELGMSKRTIIESGAVHGVVVGLLGALGAVVVAIAISPLLPRGVSRTADPDVGVHADLVVLGLGVVLTVSIAAALGSGAMAWATRPAPTTTSSGGALRRLVADLPTSVATGVRSALSPTSAGPGASLRIGLLGLGVILTALIAVASMQSSFDRVLADPAISGSTWDMTAVWGDAEPVLTDAATEALDADPSVLAFAPGGWGEIEVNGRNVTTAYLEPGHGVDIAVDRGRAPSASDEIALGQAEMEALGVGVGDRVEVTAATSDGGTAGDEPVTATVTGRAILAAPVYRPLEPGEGAAVTTGLLQRLLGEEPATGAFIDLVDDGPLFEVSNAVADRIQPAFWFARADRGGVRSLQDVRQLPAALLALLGALAAAALVHRLVTSSRAARRDQAVLRSLGFADGQFVRAGAAQGAAVSILALAGAVPAGLICARIGWRRIADYLRIVPSPAIPIELVIALCAAGVTLAIAAGVALSAHARRARPGVVLRSE